MVRVTVHVHLRCPLRTIVYICSHLVSFVSSLARRQSQTRRSLFVSTRGALHIRDVARGAGKAHQGRTSAFLPKLDGKVRLHAYPPLPVSYKFSLEAAPRFPVSFNFVAQEVQKLQVVW